MPNFNNTANQPEPNSIVLVHGKIQFSRITRRIEGDELKKENARRANSGKYPMNNPYTTITISNPTVTYTDGQPNAADTFVESKFRQSKTTGLWTYTAVNQTTRLPGVYQMNGNNGEEIEPEGELAVGLDVTLVVRIFKTQMRPGISLDRVLVNEPVRYFNGQNVTSALAKLGISVTDLPSSPNAPASSDAPAEMPAAPVAPAQTGFYQPPAAPATGTPFGGGNQFAYQPPQQQPPQNPGYPGQNFGYNNQQGPAVARPGIRYDGNPNGNN